MNILILGFTNKAKYVDGITTYAHDDNVVLYTFESHFSEELDGAAEELDLKLFVRNYYNRGDVKIDKLIFFATDFGLTEVMTATESIAHKKPVIFIPV